VSKRNRPGHKKIFIGPPHLTRFERARIVGARALQLSMGAPLLIEVAEGVGDPVDLALKELEVGVLPITIRRRLPDGTYQDIPIQWLT
jgi:DNA-directed RNA polymerase I, II, and III subunit RPABC2